MKQILAFASLFGLIGCAYQETGTEIEGLPRINPDAEAVSYINGRWLSEVGGDLVFVEGARHMDNGVFVGQPPENAKVVDLQGRFVVPPYGEAHNHSVDGPGTRTTAERYMSQGIFYYKNPNSIYSLTEPGLPLWSKAATLDVTFSYGGLSKDEGHPETLYRMLNGWGLYTEIDVEALDGEAFFEVTTLDSLTGKWPSIIAQEPDFIKLYLLEHDLEDNEGLTEPVFREAVRLAQERNLPTTVHVETVQDLALAVDAGATEAAHLPAYNLGTAKSELQSRLSDELIETMADKGFIVVTTVNVTQGRKYSDEEMKVVTDRQADNLLRLYQAGVPLAIGSDSFQQTAWNEVLSLKKLGIFDDATLFQLWIETPKLSIFPGRAIGKLTPGYEASFLVLDCNPLQAIDCSQTIELGVKQGVTVIPSQTN